MTAERTIEELRDRLAVLERDGKARVCAELGDVPRFPPRHILRDGDVHQGL